MTSVGSLVALAIERYTVCYYFADKHMRIRTKYYIIGGTWIYGLLMTVPPLFGWGRYVQDIFEPSCTFDYYSHDLNAQTFLAYLLIGGFFVPAVVIVFCYFSMFRQILKNERTMEEMSLRPVANSKEKKVSGLKESKSLGVSTPFDRRYSAFVCNRTNGLSDCASGATEVPIGRQLRRTVSLNEILFESPKYLADSLQKSTVSPSTWSIPSFNVSMSRTEIRFVKLTLIVISAFFICWTPYATLTLLCQFRVNAAFNSTAAAITLIFAKSSVAVNPIIYAFQERKFRLEVVGLIAGIAKKLRSSKFQ